MHAFVVRRKLAPAFISLEASKSNISHDATAHKSYQFNSPWVMPTTNLWASVSLLFHWQKQISKFTVCYGDHLWRAEKKTQDGTELPRDKKTGDFLHIESRLQRGETDCWTLTQKLTGKTKAQSPWGCLHEFGVLASSPAKEHCLIWTIVSRGPLTLPDKWLCQSSIQ